MLILQWCRRSPILAAGKREHATVSKHDDNQEDLMAH